MTDGGLPASKKLKAADGSSAAAPVVAEDEPSGLLPPSISVIQSADDLHAVLAESRGDASRTTAFKRWVTVRALKAALDEGATMNEDEVRTARNALYFFCAEVQYLSILVFARAPPVSSTMPFCSPSLHAPPVWQTKPGRQLRLLRRTRPSGSVL